MSSDDDGDTDTQEQTHSHQKRQILDKMLEQAVEFVDRQPTNEKNDSGVPKIRLLATSVVELSPPRKSGSFVRTLPHSKRPRYGRTIENLSTSEIASVAVNAETVVAGAAPLQSVPKITKAKATTILSCAQKPKQQKETKRKKMTTAEKDAMQARRIAEMIAKQQQK